ncbi:transcriptional repressor [Alicyclobacillus tolerans]|uniref:Fur family transcriptional regulator n=1 Tax=Alicyclobacillus tolerans TaxID=90970 RepID=UPI001F3168CF|nr:Fur family transcriptional regulator [Alicyclobacillus tolerans]MCF8564281.1 transcriptional repressor [Alicyclobacillus tolerans]
MKLDAIKTLLNDHNFRLTQERETVLTAFMNADRMLTPAQLHALVKGQQTKVGLTTVYRLLEVLTKVRLATPFLIDGEIFYTFCSEQHHHHFVCLNCHRVKDIYECPAALPANPNFGSIEYHRLDLYGHCPSCDDHEKEGALC